MATNQQNVPEFKLVLVGDGGVGMFDNLFLNMKQLIFFLCRENNVC